ncbi:MAG: zinc dependent phospholipase C family protein [Bacteroidetes bacterium]|nr:zinc dependent phospholipase C family protein [Bacteroidota bacterium]
MASLATTHPNYYALGAVGPDFFFFLPDFRNHLASPLIGVVDFLDNAYSLLDSWILEDWERYLGPVSQNIDEVLSRLTGDVSTVVSNILGSLSSLLSNLIIDLASQAHDWWGYFSLGLNKGYDNKDFFWSDMLHYRKTSLFAHNLWKIADERAAAGGADDILWSDRLKAYALGYMTHVATDTTGHAFVNEKCGGPFRTHWQRHHLIENHIDAKTYDDLHGADLLYNMFTECALHYRIAFADDGGTARSRPAYAPGDDSIRGLYVRRRLLDLDSEMPDELAQLLHDAMDRTYQTQAQWGDDTVSRTSPHIIPDDPSDTEKDGRPDVTTIQETYLTLFRYLKKSTLDGFTHEKPQPPDVFPNLDFPILTDPHDSAPGEGDHDMSDWDWFLAILRFLCWLVAVAVWLATILPAIILDLGTYPFRVIAYYTIELPLYLMVKAERAVMVMTGYFHPMKDEIEMGLVQIGNNRRGNFLQVLALIDDVLGFDVPPTREPVPDPNYPHQTRFEEPVVAGVSLYKTSDEYHHPWAYPDTPAELCHTFAGPWRDGAMPDALLGNDIPTTESVVEKYANAATPHDTDHISFSEVTDVHNLGDPVNFSSFMMWDLARPETTEMPDWNLDADRGYGYKCWDWNRHSDKLGEPKPLKDTEGHPYFAPCTPPPQTNEADGRYNPDQPLKIYYLDGADPGCDVNVDCPQ